MSSREGGGGLSEADVKVAIARLQVKPPIPRNVLKPNFGMHFLKPPIPPPKTCDCAVMLQAAFDEERSQMKGQMLDLRSELDKAR